MQVLCSGNQEPILVGSLSVYQRQRGGFLSINQSSYVTCTWRCTVKFVLWVARSSRSAAPEEADPDLRQCLVSSTDWILSEDTCFVLFYVAGPEIMILLYIICIFAMSAQSTRSLGSAWATSKNGHWKSQHESAAWATYRFFGGHITLLRLLLQSLLCKISAPSLLIYLKIFLHYLKLV